MFANVMIPAVSLPFMALLLPWNIALVIGTEMLVWKRFDHSRSWDWIFSGVLFSNLISTLIGCVGIFFIPLPSGWEDGPKGFAVPAPEYWSIVLTTLAVGCGLSIVIEYLVLVPVRRRYALKRLELCVIVANVASYAALAVSMELTRSYVLRER